MLTKRALLVVVGGLLVASPAGANLQVAGYVSACDARGEPTGEVLVGVWVTGWYHATHAEDQEENATTDADGYFYMDGDYNDGDQYCERDRGFKCEIKLEHPGYEPLIYADRWYNDNNNNDLRHFTNDQNLAIRFCLRARPPVDHLDSDGDGVDDEVDNCAYLANPGQGDGDQDGIGDACDPSPDGVDPLDGDQDGDAWGDAEDNCPSEPNEDQADADGDGLGDACDQQPFGDPGVRPEADAGTPPDPGDDSGGDSTPPAGGVDDRPPPSPASRTGEESPLPSSPDDGGGADAASSADGGGCAAVGGAAGGAELFFALCLMAPVIRRRRG